MARTFSRNSQVYPAGSYGPFSIDAFTRDDTERIRLTMTVEGWPDVPVVAVITMTSDAGQRMVINVPGRPKNRDGSDATVFSPSMAIRRLVSFDEQGQVVSQSKVQTTHAQIEVELLVSLRTAIELRAE